MSYPNLTPIRIGMTGRFAGKQYRVAGRIVMGMDDEGETYYWNEFNLVSDDGDSVTLVYEVTEGGGEWRLFTLFEPDNPISVQEAGSKCVGDTVNLDGKPIRVTLVDESQVYHIEGQAPEGVEVGDVAHYFNAEAGNSMIVVSWTGDEVEYYRGLDLPRATVASVFNLGSGLASEAPTSSFKPSFLSGGSIGSPPSTLPLKLVVAFFAFAVLIGGYAIWRSKRPQNVVAKAHAPAAPLTVGNAGTLEGKHYRIRAHALVEIAQVGRLYDRHEYLLADDDGNSALLVYGSKPRAKDWVLFMPLQPAAGFTPQKAAAVCYGEFLDVEGVRARVSGLFQSTVRVADFDKPESSSFRSGDIFYGFAAEENDVYFLARWNEQGFAFHRGKILPSETVTTAFK